MADQRAYRNQFEKDNYYKPTIRIPKEKKEVIKNKSNNTQKNIQNNKKKNNKKKK